MVISQLTPLKHQVGGTDIKERTQDRDWMAFSIGYPGIVLDAEPISMEEPAAKLPCTLSYPIGYPCVLMILSAVMWSMWTVAMMLKQIGYRWVDFECSAYWRQENYDSVITAKRKPPDPVSNKRRLFL